jgi:hypothetical protein
MSLACFQEEESGCTISSTAVQSLHKSRHRQREHPLEGASAETISQDETRSARPHPRVARQLRRTRLDADNPTHPGFDDLL